MPVIAKPSPIRVEVRGTPGGAESPLRRIDYQIMPQAIDGYEASCRKLESEGYKKFGPELSGPWLLVQPYANTSGDIVTVWCYRNLCEWCGETPTPFAVEERRKVRCAGRACTPKLVV